MHRRLRIPSTCIPGNRVSINVSDNILPHNLWEWLLLPFIILLMTVTFVEGWSKITTLYGFLFGFLFLIYFLYHRLTIPPEVFIYFAWIIWSFMGMLNVTDNDLYLTQLGTIIKMGVMIFLVAGITALRKNLSVPMLAITIGGIIVGLSGYYTGELQMSVYIASHTQVEGLTRNANSFAYHLLFVIFAMFFLWESKSSLWQRIFFSSIIGMAVIGVTYSASRKGFLGVLAFMLLWFYFCQGRRFTEKPIRVFMIFLLLSGLAYFSVDYAMSHTYLGKRYERLVKFGRFMEYGEHSRIQMYRDGLEMIKEKPICGVGLDQFRVLSSSGLYSHSDYIEVAANTGIVGFVLYFSIFVVLWLRLNRIKRMTNDPHLLYIIGFFKAAIITILLVAFGRPNIASKLTWVFLAGAIGYSWSIEHVLLSKLRYIRKLALRE